MLTTTVYDDCSLHRVLSYLVLFMLTEADRDVSLLVEQ